MGDQPRWRGDGEELFFLEGDSFMAVSVQTSPSFEYDIPRELFEARVARLFFTTQYDVTEDGERFLVNVNETRSRPALGVFLNWPAALER